MEKSGGSRLLQMQARFQQKQLQERELKIASLYEAQQARALDRVRRSPVAQAGSPPPAHPVPPPHNHQPGKVRQMFEERRTKAGIDKSYPLQPIQNTERAARPGPARKPQAEGPAKCPPRAADRRPAKPHTSASAHTVNKQHSVQKVNKLVNGSGDVNHNDELDINSNSRCKVSKSNGELIANSDEVDKADSENNYLLEDETFPEALAPAPTPRSPTATLESKRSPRIVQATRTTPTRQKTTHPVKQSTGSTPAAAVARGADHAVTKSHQPQNASQKVLGKGNVVQSSPAAVGGRGSGEECAVCGRRFAPDRLAKHQEICAKAHAKKRKPFDALKHRLAGTEAEPFLAKVRKSGGAGTVAGPTVASAPKSGKQLNNNWRQKHQEFIQAIRAAKQVQAHLNAGGKLSELPPPPPSENPDYVKCPHCSRRFNQGAAERHIPKCANYQFNKPKPKAKPAAATGPKRR